MRSHRGLLNKDDRNFWSEIKRIRSSSVGSSKIVDGITDTNSISKLFAYKYRELYSSVSYNKIEMQNIIVDINNKIAQENCFDSCLFNASDAARRSHADLFIYLGRSAAARW